MKKKTSIVSLFFFLLLILLGGCGGNSLDSKIEKGESLSEEDYVYMTDYMYDAMSEIETINRTYDSYDVEGVMEAGHEVAKEYPNFKIYFSTCMEAMDKNDPALENSKLDRDKLARVIHCVARGWDMFW